MSSDPSLTSQVSLSCSQVMGRICSKVRLFSEASPSDSLKCMYFMMEARRLNPWAWKCEGPLSCVWTFTQLTRHHVLSLGCVWISSGISEALNILLFLIYLFLPLSSFFFVQVDKLFSDAHCSSWFINKATEEQPWSRYIQGNGGDSAKGIGPVTHAVRCFQWQHISDRTDVITVTHITYQQSSSEGFKTASDTKWFLLCLFICFFSFGSTPKTKIRQPSFSWPTILTSKLKYTAKREQIIMKWITQIQWGKKNSAWDGVFIHLLIDLINVTGVQITVWGFILNVIKVYELLSGLTITTPQTGSSC